MLFLTLLWSLQDSPKDPAVVLRIEPLERVYRPGEPMAMRFVVENATDRDVELEEPIDYLEGLQVRDPEARVVKTPARIREVKRKHRVDARGFFGRTLDISRILSVPEDREGAYTLRWQFQDHASAEVRVFVIRDWLATVETSVGNIVLEFHPESAPMHVLNFLSLARKGYYKDCRFYRVIPGFMMQGGDPEKAAKLSPVTAEFSDRKHLAGTLSMARGAAPNTATSEFFICFAASPQLDRAYSVFGSVTQGMECVQAIERVKTDHSPCASCGQTLPSRATQHCGAHHQDRPISPEIVIKNIALSVRKKP